MDNSPPGSSVYGISQARILEQVAVSSSSGSPDPGIKLGSPASPVGSLLSEPQGMPKKEDSIHFKNLDLKV